jgi:transposase
MRQIEFLDTEVAEVERLIARDILWSADTRILLSVPGVNLICAATFLAAIGDIRRFSSSRKLVAYLGLDPKVRQSGSEPARTGRISKQGSPQARWALVEATHSVILQPGPLRAFHQRIRSRRGYQIATVAAARKLACLFWCLLTRDENYAHAQPSLTAKKLRKLELIAGAKRFDRSAAGIWTANQAVREAEKQLARQAETSYVRMVRDWQATAPKKVGASATPERA